MIYLSTGVFQTRSLPQILTLCERNGLSGLELSSGLERIDDLDDVLRRAMVFQPLLIHNYFPAPADPFVLNLASTDPSIRAASMSLCRNAVDACRRVGAPFYSVHGGFRASFDVNHLGRPEAQSALTDKAASYDRAYDLFCAQMADLSRYAADRGVRLLVENNVLTSSNLDREGVPQLLITHPDEIERFFDDVSDPNLGLLLDVGHLKVSAATLGFDRDACLAQLAGRIEAFHLSDNDGVRDTNHPFDENAWFLPHLKRFPGAVMVLEAYGLTIPHLFTQRNLIATRLSADTASEHEID